MCTAFKNGPAVPEFKGETYSYGDAKRRAPHAWRMRTVEWVGAFWSDRAGWIPTICAREEWECVAPKGLGHFEYRTRPAAVSYAAGWYEWIYVLPNGYAHPVSPRLQNSPEPPPLPRPKAEWEKATCWDGPHNCSACGMPYWIEIHGVADGYCTYCYHRG